MAAGNVVINPRALGMWTRMVLWEIAMGFTIRHDGWRVYGERLTRLFSRFARNGGKQDVQN